MCAPVNSSRSRLDDPVLYIYLFGYTTFGPAFLSQSILLYQIWKNKLGNHVSGNIIINMVMWCLYLFVGMAVAPYAIVYLEEPKPPYVLFFVGTLYAGINIGLSVSILFLSLDRIFALLLPFKYKKYRKEFIIATITLCSVMCVFVFTSIIVIDLPVLPPTTTCKSYSGLTTNKSEIVRVGSKITFLSLGFVFSTIFIGLMCGNAKRNDSLFDDALKIQFKRANRIVLLAVISEFFFSFIPQFFNGLFAILNIDDSFLGSYLSATGGIDALVVAIVYRRSIMRRFNQVEPKLIGPSTTGQAPSNNTML